MILVIDAAVVSAVGKYGESDQIRRDLGAVGRIVNLQHHPRDDLGILLVTDVDDARQWERRESGCACPLRLRDAAQAA